MSYPQYGIYLIPPPALIQAVAQGHALLASEFNARTGGRFMVHCTVKGFFKLAEGARPDDFVAALDELFARTPLFYTSVTELYLHQKLGEGAAALLLERNEAFESLHNAILDIVRPFISPECLFTPTEMLGPDFRPHLTLGMADMPTEAGLLTQAFELCQYIYEGLPQEPFESRNMQLIEFQSENWGDHWWETLSYRQLKGWQLQAE